MTDLNPHMASCQTLTLFQIKVTAIDCPLEKVLTGAVDAHHSMTINVNEGFSSHMFEYHEFEVTRSPFWEELVLSSFIKFSDLT